MVLSCALGPTENLFYYAPDERDAALVAHPDHGEVLAILKRCYADATALIALHCDRVGALADRLIEARALDDPVIKSILMPRKAGQPNRRRRRADEQSLLAEERER
jgi:hypothetical protein